MKTALDSASVFVSSQPYTPEELAAIPAFFNAAWNCIADGKTYTRDMIEDYLGVTIATARAAVGLVRPRYAEYLREQEAEAKLRAKEQAKLRAKADRIAERERPTKEAVQAAWEAADFRTCRQGHETIVRIGDTPSIECGTERGERYSSRCTFRKTESWHRFTVRRDWLARVQAHGLDKFIDALVVDAELLGTTDDGKAVYRVLLAEQAAGTGLKEYRGLISVGRRGDGFRKIETAPQLVKWSRSTPLGVIADWLAERGNDRLASQMVERLQTV